jgi:hypothetical protein
MKILKNINDKLWVYEDNEPLYQVVKDFNFKIKENLKHKKYIGVKDVEIKNYKIFIKCNDDEGFYIDKDGNFFDINTNEELGSDYFLSRTIKISYSDLCNFNIFHILFGKFISGRYLWTPFSVLKTKIKENIAAYRYCLTLAYNGFSYTFINTCSCFFGQNADISKKEPYQMLNISKILYKIITYKDNHKICNTGSYLVRTYKKIEETKNVDTLMNYLWQNKEAFSYDEILSLCTIILEEEKLYKLLNYNMDYKVIFQYLLRYENEGYESPGTMFNTFYDYIELTKLLNEENKYPKFLMSQEQILSRQYEKIKDKILNENIEKNYKKLKKYETTIKKYIFKIPKNVEEIIYEGKYQNHCIHSYTHKTIEENYMMVFVRKIEDPETPYLTFLFKDKDIDQARGKNNRFLNDEEKIVLNNYVDFIQKIE